MQAVILAAGKGTRLAPITNSRSKGMLPIVGKPILERIIDGMVASGLRDFILVVSPEDREIREYFQGESSLDIQTEFVDQARQLGTADALRQAAPYLTEAFILSACDNLVPDGEMNNLISTWSQHPVTQGLLSLERIPIQDTVKTGIVTLVSNQITGIVEKPLPDDAPSNISSTPLYVFSTRILDYLPLVPLSTRDEYELQDAIQTMIDDGHVVRGLFLKDRLTLTTAEDFLALNLQYLESEGIVDHVETQNIGSRTGLIAPVYIEAGVEIGADCQIGPGVYIEKDASIGDRVRLENVAVLQGSAIPKEIDVKNLVIHRETEYSHFE
jgi:NDP-sugar pyrophosphorylase family protein